MRLDKYLKVSRLIKRRTVAKEICDAGKIDVNGRPAKAGHEVKVGDRLAIRFGNRHLTVEIAEIRETVRADQADSLYRVLEDKKIHEKKELWEA